MRIALTEVPLWAALLPVAAYLVAVGCLHLRPRPVALSGHVDVALLTLGIAGMVIAGPLALLQPGAGTSAWTTAVLLLGFAVVVAGAVLAARPRLLLADEPTTALDVIVQAGILELLADLRRSEGMGLLFISHDLAVVAAVCDRIAVMYAGEIVEEGPTAQVLSQPNMPYTMGLLASTRRVRGTRRLSSIAGAPPPPGERPSSCRFAARCPLVVERCLAGPIPLANVAPGRTARCVRAAEVSRLDPSIFASTEKVVHV